MSLSYHQLLEKREERKHHAATPLTLCLRQGAGGNTAATGGGGAEEAVEMAATLSSFVTVFLDKLTAIQEEASVRLGVTSELESLEGKIKDIKCLLAHAESKAFYSEAIRLRLNELKDVMYDADDIIDDCRVVGETAASGKPCESSPSIHVVRPSLSSSLFFLNKVIFKHKIGKRLERINSMLEEISREMSQFQLTPEVEENKMTRLVSYQTSSLVETDIAGAAIQKDSKKLIKMLVEGESKGNGWVIAITGMGGIGKTTLAQIIYNDQLIKATFRMRVWVCVSKELSEIKLLREVVECAGGAPGDAHTKGQLQVMLRSLTLGKKLLLVLDDTWSADVWEDLLQKPLQGAAAGSKVLITSRFESVARQVGVVHLHRVEQMSPADGWSLLCKKAFTHGEGGERESLRDVGDKIVERCGGLPLAIKVVGGVLRRRARDRWGWEEVLHSQTWSSSIFPEDMRDGVMEALHLSYEDLPSHLKRCFLYLSLFPEDHVFKRPSVVRQWIAEGFVRSDGNELMLEDVGKEYFKELVERSLLQPEMALVDGAQCRMHDLLRTLAQFLAEGENFSGDTSMLKDAPPKLRRLSIAAGGAVIDLDVLKTKEYLRTLFLFKSPHGGLVLSQDVVETLQLLRVLDLREAHIEQLPHSVTKLRHLRYLDVSGTAIRELPESISDLRSLQFLFLNNCRNIHALPNGITELKNLSSLELYNGTEVDQMPKGIGGLIQLRNLKEFVVDKDKGALEELGSLVNLRLLDISKMERVFDKAQARSAALHSKTSLIFLSLVCTLPKMATSAAHGLLHLSAEDEEMKRRMVDVFDELCPPSSLEMLVIIGYVGLRLPHWMWPSTASSASPIHNLTTLELYYCINFSQVLPLGLLPNLKQLWISGAFLVITIIPNLPNSTVPTHPSPSLSCSCSCSPSTVTTAAATTSTATVLFPKLEWLSIIEMPNLETIWDWKTERNGEHVRAFPCLQYLYVGDCPKLRCLPDGPMPVLKSLQIVDCPPLMEVSNLSAPESFVIHDGRSEGLPSWLRQVFVDPKDDEAFLFLRVKSSLLKRIVHQKEEDPNNPEGDWHTIKRFPRVHVKATDEESAFLSYNRDALIFNTNVKVGPSSSSEDMKNKRQWAE